MGCDWDGGGDAVGEAAGASEDDSESHCAVDANVSWLHYLATISFEAG